MNLNYLIIILIINHMLVLTIISILFCCVNLIICIYLFAEIKLLKSQYLDAALIICKLMFHVSKEIGDYKTTDKIYKGLNSKTDLYKFMDDLEKIK